MEEWYDKEEDVLNIELNKGIYWKSIELSRDITLDITEDGTITGLEIMHASKVFSGDAKKVIEQAKSVIV